MHSAQIVSNNNITELTTPTTTTTNTTTTNTTTNNTTTTNTTTTYTTTTYTTTTTTGNEYAEDSIFNEDPLYDNDSSEDIDTLYDDLSADSEKPISKYIDNLFLLKKNSIFYLTFLQKYLNPK